jgi:dual specificity tyrosine-phosphorylation-regulated kinase 2/3/4
MKELNNSYISQSSIRTLDQTDIEDGSEDCIIHRQRKSWDEMSFSADPEHVLENFSHCLSPFEVSEIVDYSHIYCISDLQHKLNANCETDYKDEENLYIVIQGDQLRYRYEIIEPIGNGVYAQVVKAYDHKLHKDVAIKIMNSKNFDVASTEFQILNFIKQHGGHKQNLLEIKKKFFFRDFVFFVFDLAKSSLYDHIKLHGPLDIQTIQKFACQLCQGLDFLETHGIIHCDFKAENLLIFENDNKELNIKIADFGLACFDHDELYPEVQSLWCRAPEVLLQTPYSTRIDIWSLGCVLAFMYTGKYIMKGEGCYDQLWAIMELFGVPCNRMVCDSPNSNAWFDDEGKLKVNKGKCKKQRVPNSICLERTMECKDKDFIDFVRCCLTIDPEKRLNAKEVLKHKWLYDQTFDLKECEEALPEERENCAIRTPTKSTVIPPSRNMFKAHFQKLTA